MSTSSPPLSASASPEVVVPRGIFTSRRGRILQENLTAYLFLFPASILIFLFGIFPVGFALYVSLHKWQLVRGKFRGMGNYTKAIDTFAYVSAFWLAIGALVVGIITLRKVIRTARERGENPALWLLPAAVTTAGVFLFVRFTVFLLPEVLDVGEKLRRQVRTQELIMQLFGDTFQVPAVAEAMWLAIIVLAVGIALAWIVYREAPSGNDGSYFVNMCLIVGFIAIGVMVLSFTFSEVEAEYAKALEDAQEISLWTQIVTISAGFVLLGLAWQVWKQVGGQSSNLRTILIMMVAVMLMGGAWMLIGELPRVIAEGDKDLFQGLLTTVYYSVFTVPVQLVISLGLAYILFQDIRGKVFFRIIYFLPYITPAVASAAVFRILFTNRPEGAVNRLIGLFGIEPQAWIQEPHGIFELLARGVGLTIPGWLEGPSMALVVIILFSIWTFVGYNTVIFLAGLGAIPGEMYEAAKVDGAGRWSLFRHITLPLLSPTTFFLSLIAIIGTFKAFNHIWVLRDAGALGTTDTASVVIFLEFFRNSKLGYASSMAFVLFGVILSLTVLQNRIASRRVFYG